jgi:hypothetical protein
MRRISDKPGGALQVVICRLSGTNALLDVAVALH